MRAVIAAAVLLLYASALAAAQPVAASEPLLRLRVSLKPLGGDKWAASVGLEAPGFSASCSGVVEANPYYRETRAVSSRLLVLPLYYIVDSVCPRGSSFLSALAARPPRGAAVLEVQAPRGYLVATPLGWGPGGVAGRVSLAVFLRYVVYDGVVVADTRSYRGIVVGGLLVVEPRSRVPGVEPRLLASAVSCVSSALTRWLGPSPAAPRVFVAAAPGEHGLVLPGTGYSLGAVVYVKPSPGSPASMVHLVSHEAVHGWIGKGPLRGGEGLVEGAAELLSLLALRGCSPRLYNLSLGYEEEASTLNPYRTWLILHAALRAAGLRACGSDIYLEALHEMYRRSVDDASWSPGLPELYAEAAAIAENRGCLEALEKALGEEMLHAAKTPLPRLLEPSVHVDEATAPSAPAGNNTAATETGGPVATGAAANGSPAAPEAAATAAPQPGSAPSSSPSPPPGPAAEPFPAPRGASTGAAAAAAAGLTAALLFLLISRVVHRGHESV